jgi:hypothetical protein
MTIYRRTFVQTATVLAVAAAGTQAAQAQTSTASQVATSAAASAADPNALPIFPRSIPVHRRYRNPMVWRHRP